MSNKNLPLGVREADELIYLNEDRRNQVKSIFKVAGKKFTDFAAKQNKRNGDLLDVGCATGDFLHHISTILTGYNLSGLEVSELIALEASKQFKTPLTKIISNDCSSKQVLSSTLPTLIEADDIRLDASRAMCSTKLVLMNDRSTLSLCVVF